MKAKSIRKIQALIVAGTFVFCQAQAQVTAVSGTTGANGCTPAAGTAGTDNTSVGCGSGQ